MELVSYSTDRNGFHITCQEYYFPRDDTFRGVHKPNSNDIMRHYGHVVFQNLAVTWSQTKTQSIQSPDRSKTFFKLFKLSGCSLLKTSNSCGYSD